MKSFENALEPSSCAASLEGAKMGILAMSCEPSQGGMLMGAHLCGNIPQFHLRSAHQVLF